jgi:hypothetical protein
LYGWYVEPPTIAKRTNIQGEKENSSTKLSHHPSDEKGFVIAFAAATQFSTIY